MSDGLTAQPARPELQPAPMEPRAAQPEQRAAVVRGGLIVVGSLSLAIGAIGLVVPVLPTTPFLLLAAACYVRASRRLHGWLLGNRTFGPIIRDWQSSRSLPRRAKWTAIPLMAVTVGASAAFFVEELLLRVGLVVLGAGLAVFLYRIPTSD